MNTTQEKLNSLLSDLEGLEQKKEKFHAIAGFDGFVDRIKRPVSSRAGVEVHWFHTMTEFAARINAAAGKSGQIEMITQKTKPGGNAPILADTLGHLGVDCLCIGAMGYPHIDSVFESDELTFRKLSLVNPGKSDAIEFDDGKIIFSELSVFDHYNWNHVKRTAGVERLKQAVTEAKLIAFVDWANLPYAADIWQGFLKDILMPNQFRDKLFLFDLCDPSRKTDDQVREVLELISSYSVHGQVTLGLNENEALRIFTSLYAAQVPDVRTAVGRLFNNMKVDYLLVHPVDRCIMCSREGVTEMEGHVVKDPAVLTGGGDNLNAGYCLGWLAGFSVEQRILLGMATSGAYVQRGYSPSLSDLKSYIKGWIRDKT